MSDPAIWGVPISQWPVDELLSLPWHAVEHLTAEEKQSIIDRAVAEGIDPNQLGGCKA